MIKIIEEMLSDFGDLVLDRFEDKSELELENIMSELDRYIGSDSTQDHIKIICSYIKMIAEAAYANNYKHEVIH